jgi:hypothetical protein
MLAPITDRGSALIIPSYWAEARLQHRERGRQITIRRFGWSEAGEADAQAHADARAREAMERALAGESLSRRERRVAYNGSEGVPIREEIVERDADTVITRNSYGALCLNTPDVLFVDIDFDDKPGKKLAFVSFLLLWLSAFNGLHNVFGLNTFAAGAIGLVIALIFGYALAMAVMQAWTMTRGGPEKTARARVAAFVAKHPDWRLRVYRTPAGLRLLAMHRRFAPRSPEVDACFKALGSDAMYVQMCRNQNCFRARVSPKPWRIGMQRIRPPYSASWRPEFAELPARRAWIESYTSAATGYASCRYLETVGGGGSDPVVEAVQRLHDLLCQAERELPIA